MADDVDKRLAEIEANKKAEKIVAAKKAAKLKEAQAKADADRKKREQERAKVAEENSQRRGAPVTQKRLSPQAEAGQGARTRENLEKINKADLANRYSQAFRTRESLIEKYSKTGDPKDKQAVLNAQAALDPIVAEYVKVFGNEPAGYKPETKPLGTASPTNKNQDQAVKPTSISTPGSMQSIEDRRGSNPNVPITPVSQTADPATQAWLANINKITGMNFTLPPELLTPGTNTASTNGGSMASIRKQTTQYSMQQVRSAADSIYQSSIGRALNDEELRMLHQSLNSTLKANPTITKTTASGNSTTYGGIDERGLMQQQAEANPEFANYQKATTYFDAMLNTLRGPVGGGI
jgi:hypothetical protein